MEKLQAQLHTDSYFQKCNKIRQSVVAKGKQFQSEQNTKLKEIFIEQMHIGRPLNAIQRVRGSGIDRIAWVIGKVLVLQVRNF
jgi:hypothetical protein